ncbi:MAG: hypothetical protein DID92_2727744092 [Candidatus Nitrotoga sp. SPKER]|nr:MAG: hypothetical protein DID92_2727744092 [Candidatus Nitrotoga sp. SPKER]
MKKSIAFLAISSCLTFGTSIAHADSDLSKAKDDKIFKMDQKLFKSMDKDSDGKVTKEEYKDFTKKKDVTDFNVWDVDGNGDINLWEMKIVSERNGGDQNSGGNSEEAGNSAKNTTVPSKGMNPDKLKIQNRDGAMDPTGAAGKSSTPSGS